MAQYKTHTKFNIFFGLPISLLFMYKFLNIPINNLMIFSLSFTYSTLFMSPDMDLANQIKLFSIKGLLTLPFRFYAKIFSHRGISHQLILGSLSRILFLLFFIFIISLLFNIKRFTVNDLIIYYKTYKSIFIYLGVGIIIADMFHLMLDLN